MDKYFQKRSKDAPPPAHLLPGYQPPQVEEDRPNKKMKSSKDQNETDKMDTKAAATTISDSHKPLDSTLDSNKFLDSTLDSDKTTAVTSKKRKREGGIVYSQPQLTGYGVDPMTQITFIIEQLKSKLGQTQTATELFDRLSFHLQSEDQRRNLVRAMQSNPRICYKPDPHDHSWMAGSYSHNPIIPNVRDADSLLALLQDQPDTSSVSVKDLKDGWPDCDETLVRLEAEHRIRTLQTKPPRVWLDDPSLYHGPVDEEFRTMWNRIVLPQSDEIVRKLKSAGLKAAGDDPDVRTAPKPARLKTHKKPAARRLVNATNTHMADLLRQWEHEDRKERKRKNG